MEMQAGVALDKTGKVGEMEIRHLTKHVFDIVTQPFGYHGRVMTILTAYLDTSTQLANRVPLTSS